MREGPHREVLSGRKRGEGKGVGVGQGQDDLECMTEAALGFSS